MNSISIKENLQFKEVFSSIKKWRWRWFLIAILCVLIVQVWWVFKIEESSNLYHSKGPSTYYWDIFGFLLMVDIVYIGLSAIVSWVVGVLTFPKRFRNKTRLITASLFLIFAVWFLHTIFINPLPSDEEFIEHFYTHREDIEYLVKCYRTNECSAAMLTYRSKSPTEIKQRLLRAGIEYIGETGTLFVGKPFDVGDEAKQKKVLTLLQLDIRQNEGKYYHDVKRRLDGISVSLDGGRSSFYRSYGYGSDLISKKLYHRPGKAIIKDGWVKWEISELDMVTGKQRIFDSLNKYPPDYWRTTECVFRQIEPEWFIKMCKSA